MTSSNSPSSRWTREHGYGSRGRGGRRDGRLRKVCWATESAASDQALLMGLKHGVAFNIYPCRWGDDYRDGETAPLHWHVGRTGRMREEAK